ncbi:CoA-acylating methylmalonate-semialdehyde dehydrogenase [Natrarchaeobius chitinivorans]|uniref:methylmalonate-semialdehyde dehydrogenase (CoA acylating) n=1 Tax=Natrarchaeobius chitinivorans TaxID=1679083 RepID=A0A3N6MID0_NATCH|nr:CoA-acylating methylmalonate-semialdehyde dehydrogenase [Natrarchaeobius chitinivorans]RQG95411.1 CoA-acylating methylmalonate-semialdehyde dehydrogenase [Natrarchaeobius chitinivorans]
MSDFRKETETVQNYVGGEWQAPTGDDGQNVINPATGQQVTHVPFSTPEDVDQAVEKSRQAFQDWRTTPVEERIQPLFRLKQLLEDNQHDLAETLVREHGKTKSEAMGEIRRGIENVEVACGIPSMMQSGTLLNAAPNIDESAPRKPLGVFTAITPFNFPAMIPLWFLPYAVATGNTFILKPSERNPTTPYQLISLVEQAGFPDGVVTLLNGGPDSVNALLEHQDVEGVSFVGSTPVAEYIYETAAQHGKRVQAQGGAKNHIIVSKHADLEFAADQTISSAFANSGQRCLANPIAVVVEDVYDEFATLVVERAEAINVGNGLKAETDMGPVHTVDHAQKVKNYIQTGIEEGADLLLDGRETDPEMPENYLGPTIFGDVTMDMKIGCEEIFGPVLGLAAVDDFEAAITRTNASRFGNAASLFTKRGDEATAFKHEVEAGNLAINAGTAAPMAFFHFGGWKDSFFGDLHAQGEDMIHFYTDKAICIERWPSR